MKELRESGEDYLEKILQLEQTNGVVRSVDIATSLNVSKPSVSRAMGVLKEAGYIRQETYGDITLTPAGREKAEEVYRRHKMLKKFLTEVLGVSPATADEDACRVEHVLSQETLRAIGKYMD